MGDNGVDKDYGVWHEFGPAEGISKGVCQTGVGSNAVFCGGCLCWKHGKCSGIKGPLRLDPDFRCARCL